MNVKYAAISISIAANRSPAPSRIQPIFCAVRSAVLLPMPAGPILPEELSKLRLTMSASRPAMPRTRLDPPPIISGGHGRCPGLGTL
jgi:hypothetical protein